MNGHIMQNPVRTPHGVVFEKESITHFLSPPYAHSECPLTGNALNLGDLQEDKALRDRITQWHIQKAMSRNAVCQEAGDEDDDIYDF